MSDEDVLAELEAALKEPVVTEDYRRLVSATRSLTYVWDVFVKVPVGSAQERILGAALEQMMSGFQNHPDKARAMIESLLALIEHMRMGGTYEQWFEDFGVPLRPGEKP